MNSRPVPFSVASHWLAVRVPLAAAMLATLVLSGCVSDAPDPADDRAAAALGWDGVVPAVGDRVMAYRYNGAASQGESFISVSPDGQTVLTCTHGGFSQPSPSVVSEDGGATWRQMVFPLDVAVGGDCETALMADGTWVFLVSTIVDNTLVTTSDGGKTFTSNLNAGFMTNGLADRPWVEAAGGRLLLTFMPLSPTPGWIGFTSSDDKAATWTQTRNISDWDESRVGVMHGHIQVHADQQRVWVPLVKYEQPSSAGVGSAPIQGTLGFAYSPDAGATWEETVLFGPMGLNKVPPTMAVAGDLLYYVHFVQSGAATVPDPTGFSTDATYDLTAWVSRDFGTTWSEPVILLKDAAPNTMWIDGAADGTATFLHQTDGRAWGHEEGQRVIGLRLDAATPGLVAYTQDFGEGGNEFVTVDHDAAGRAYVSYGEGEGIWVVKEL